MTTQLKFRRGNALQVNGFIGADSELTVDTQNRFLHIGDGLTPGGVPVDLTFDTLASLNTYSRPTTAPFRTIIAQALGATEVGDGGGGFFQWIGASTVTADGVMVVANSAGTDGRWHRIWDRQKLQATWFGYKGTGMFNVSPALQAAVNYAKSLTAGGGGAYRVAIALPAGFGYMQQPINITKANGVWLCSDGGNYINTGLIGDTGGVMLDFTGSTMAGFRGIGLYSYVAYPTPSTIGALFALDADNSGGLNGGYENTYIQMADFTKDVNGNAVTPTVNGGAGSIGVVNIRAEEFEVGSNVLIKANLPVVYSANRTISQYGSLAFQSPFNPIANGQGSMGVIDMTNGPSLKSFGRYAPSVYLCNTNGFSFNGYMGIETSNGGSLDIAILIDGQCDNLTWHGTVEGFATLYKQFASIGKLINIDVAHANIPAPNNRAVIDITGSNGLRSCNIKVTYPNGGSEVPNSVNGRYGVYSGPIVADNVITAGVSNCEFHFPEAQNSGACNPALLKNTENTAFATLQPFKVEAGVARQLFRNPVTCGTVGATTPATILRFQEANNATPTVNNGGYYKILVEGVVRVGNSGSGGQSTRDFRARIVQGQVNTGAKSSPAITVELLGESSASTAYVDVTAVAVALTFAGGIGSIVVTPTVTGTGTGEGIVVEAMCTVQSVMSANGTTVFS